MLNSVSKEEFVESFLDGFFDRIGNKNKLALLDEENGMLLIAEIERIGINTFDQLEKDINNVINRR